MAKTRIIAGIDIGSSKITTIIASCSSERKTIDVTGVATVKSRGLRKSQIIDIEEATESIAESVEKAERMAGFALSSAYVSIGGIHIDSLNSKGVVAVTEPEAEIREEDVKRVLESARAVSLPSSREILHVIPRNFIVDSQGGIKDPLGMTGVRLEVEAHIVTGATTAIRNLKKCVGEIGIDVEGVVFAGVAASEAVLTETEKELGVCLIDVGGGTTNICVFQEGSLCFSSVLPVGASHVTNDLAIGLRVSLESAEKIKRFLGKKEKKPILPEGMEAKKEKDEIDLSPLKLSEELRSVSKKTVVEGIIRPRLNEIFTIVGEKLKKSGLGGATPAGIVITGGGAETVGMLNSCKRILSMPTRIGIPKGVSGLIEEIEVPAFAASVGLILYGGKHDTHLSGRISLRKMGKLVGKIPIKGLASKTLEFIKSFLP